MNEQIQDRTDVVVVGGGLAGLVAAVDAARAGAAVALVEARDAGGGRARSDRVDGFTVNHGAHALYRAGAARAVLDDLGVPWSGRRPRVRGSGVLIEGRRVAASNLGALGGAGALRALVRASRSGTAERYRGRTMGEWFADQPERARPLLWAAIRTSTYQADLDGSDAEAILTQLGRGAKGVDYLDGGWQSLVDGLQAEVDRAGVRRVTAKARRVEVADGGGGRVDTTAGPVDAAAVVLAVGGPVEAARLLDGASPTMTRWAAVAEPVVAATLEVLLRRKPLPRAGSYSLDEPIYSVDAAASCRIAPDGGAVVHGIFYEPDRRPIDRPVEGAPRQRLEAALDAWQPGWREHVVDVIERKRLVVAHDRPRLAPAGDRPSVVVPDLDGVFLASDAITSGGMLADAAVGSGREAGRAAAARARSQPGLTAVGQE